MGRTSDAPACRSRTGTVPAWWVRFLLGGGLVLGGGLLAAAVSPALALDVRVAAPGESLEDAGPADGAAGFAETAAIFAETDTLVATFQLHDVFGGNESLGDGIPATLVLVVDLWRDRSGWWDSLVRSHAFTYQFRRDTWSGEYSLRGIDGTVTTVADRARLLGVLERVHEIVLGLPRHFEPGKRYYVTVKALIKPMELDDLQKVDSWLSGDVASSGGGGGGGVLGIPKALARIVVDVSGLGDQTVVGESVPFVPRP